MTERLTVVAHLRAETSLIKPTRAKPGAIEYSLHRDNDDPAEFTSTRIGRARLSGTSTCPEGRTPCGRS